MISMTGVAGRVQLASLMTGALVLMVATAGSVVALTTSDSTRTIVLVSVAAVFFCLGLAVGSTHVLMAATVPMLGAVVWDILVTTEQVWSRSLIIGCLWFCAGELGDLAIRWRTLRRGRHPSASASDPVEIGLIRDRLSEMSLVVGASAVAVIAGTVVGVVSVSRTVFVQALALLIVALAVAVTGRRLSAVDWVRGR